LLEILFLVPSLGGLPWMDLKIFVVLTWKSTPHVGFTRRSIVFGNKDVEDPISET
jgi:hypothetical protein